MSDTIRRRSSFSVVPEWLIKADISAHAVRLYAALDRYADLPKGAIPSRQTLANEWLHCSLDTVDRAKRELIEVGALTVEKTGRNNNLYTLEDRPNSRTGAVVNSRTGAAGKRDIEREDSAALQRTQAGAVVDGAQDIVAGYCDVMTASGSPVPRRLVGMVAKQVGELVRDGIEPDVIRRSLGLMIERGLHPSTLPTLVPEAARGSIKGQAQRFGRGMTVDAILAMKGEK